jgi:RNA polymerase primary sigma factor
VARVQMEQMEYQEGAEKMLDLTLELNSEMQEELQRVLEAVQTDMPDDLHLDHGAETGLDWDKSEDESETVLLAPETRAKKEDWVTLANLRHPLLCGEEERLLTTQVRYGSPKEKQAARDRLVACNQRLVLCVSRKWLGQGMELADLMQEGNLGLLQAIKRFEPERGLRFSTYATWWVRQAIGRAVAEQGRMIRVPVYKHEQIYRYKRAYEQLEMELLREPTDEEVAQRIGTTAESIREWKLVSSPASLSLEINEEHELGDVLCDPNEDVEEAAIQGPQAELIKQALNVLTPRECKVIQLRFGLLSGYAHTLEETGKQLGFTRERARQIEERALAKLRASQYIQALVS